jgi:hypothetical protein
MLSKPSGKTTSRERVLVRVRDEAEQGAPADRKGR